jgi:lipopolysaccharide transport system permease protein
MNTTQPSFTPKEYAPKQVIIEPSRGFTFIPFHDLWEYRELLLFLIWRDLKVRYKQTFLGVSWILLQPLVSTFVFTFLFGSLLKVPSGNVPYSIFTFTALVPWQYFASSLTKSSVSLVTSSNLITKVYFPRLIIPLASVLSGLVDFSISFAVLTGLLLIYQVKLSLSVLVLPALLLLLIITALGFSLWLSALNVRYRDINYLVPFLVQTWMYITPVIYSSSLIPDQFRFLLGLNPMTAVVEGFRWALLGNALIETHTSYPMLALSVAITIVVLISGVLFFRYTERTFADII